MLDSELLALLEHTADAAFAITDDGRIRSWNRAAERMLGHAASRVVGRLVADVLGAPALDRGARTRLRRRGDDECVPPTIDVQLRTESGALLWASVSTIVHRDRRTGCRLFIQLARDIDQRRRNEELLARLLETQQHVSLRDAALESREDALSDQERRILRLLATGVSSPTIAASLGISAQTLRNHVHHINRKLRTHNRLEAVTHAQRRGLIE